MKIFPLNIHKINKALLFRSIKFIALVILYCLPLDAKESVLEANHGGRDYFYKALSETPGDILIGSFKLNPSLMPDPELIQILGDRTQANQTTVLLESRLTPEEIRGNILFSAHDSLHKFLQTHAQILANIKSYTNVHVKVLIAPTFALIGTTNYDGTYEECISRDFTALIENPLLLKELHDIFHLIEQGVPVNWTPYMYSVKDIEEGATRLTWGPTQHYAHLIEMIESAQYDISIYQQDLQDRGIIKALEDKLTQGLEVRILMSHHPFGPKASNKSLSNLKKLVQAGAHVRLTGHNKLIQYGLPLHIHAKVLLIDRHTKPLMYLGSANFYEAVLDPKERNLNLGLITRSHDYIDSVKAYFEEDWLSHSDQSLKIDA